MYNHVVSLNCLMSKFIKIYEQITRQVLYLLNQILVGLM